MPKILGTAPSPGLGVAGACTCGLGAAGTVGTIGTGPEGGGTVACVTGGGAKLVWSTNVLRMNDFTNEQFGLVSFAGVQQSQNGSDVQFF